jgi:hAT family C-terminal dimerisation region
MNPENFSNEKIEGIYDTCKEYVFTLFDKTENVQNESTYENMGNQNVEVVDGNMILNTIPEECTLDDFTLHLYSVQQLNGSNDLLSTSEKQNDTSIDTGESSLKKRKQQRENIIRQMNEYIYYCTNIMNVEELLKGQYGNKIFLKEQKTIIFERITKYKDVYYAFPYFNLLLWWKNVGQQRFPELAIAASLMLGKPTHNGFQERVFSKGTYTDTKLRQRLTERNFEMAVLNSLNSKHMGDVKNKAFFKQYKENQKINDKEYIESVYKREHNRCDILSFDPKLKETETENIHLDGDSEKSILYNSDCTLESDFSDNEEE